MHVPRGQEVGERAEIDDVQHGATHNGRPCACVKNMPFASGRSPCYWAPVDGQGAFCSCACRQESGCEQDEL